jgi:hypothetical protein
LPEPIAVPEQSHWEDLAREFRAIKVIREPLCGSWYAFVGSENHGVWLIHPDDHTSEESRAQFSLMAARAIELLEVPPIPAPDSLQYFPALQHYRQDQQEGSSADEQDTSRAFRSGLLAVDPCTRAWLEVLRRESCGFELYPSSSEDGQDSADDQLRGYEATSGAIPDLCQASAIYCTKQATLEIGSKLSGSKAALSNSLQENASAVGLARVTDPDIAAARENASGTRTSEITHKRLSTRDLQVHAIVGERVFRNLTNREIMKDLGLKRRLRTECKLNLGDAAKSCLDRIRNAKGYPLSREIAKKRSTAPHSNGQKRSIS